MFTPREILGPTGSIARRLDNYELRPQQLEMADAVAAALHDRQHLIVEAGTGVGKSFGYLVPAILAVTSEEERDAGGDEDDEDEHEEKLNRRPIVVSTHTISLQEQLLSKDLPFLRAVTPLEFSAVLVKGRGNYISLRRLGRALEKSQSLFQDAREIEQLHQIRDWTQDTRDGSLSDLPFRPRADVWDEVASDSGNCLGKNCPQFDRCHYYSARSYVRSAQILVVNHALFFSDLALRRVGASILPNYRAVIFDEAHTLESVAGQHLGLSVSSGQIEFQLNRLYNDQTNKGLLVFANLTRAQELVDQCRVVLEDFLVDLRDWQQQNANRNGRVRQPESFPNRLGPVLAELAREITAHADDVVDPSQRQDFVSARDRLNALANDIHLWISQQLPGSVYWVEVGLSRRQYLRATLAAAPINVGAPLHEQLFQQNRTVIMTSATLTTGRPGSFEFFQRRVGCTQAVKIKLGSPFNFRRQAKIVVVRGMPDPNEEKDAYDRVCTMMIQRFAGRSDGHAFALFTSYDMIRRVAEQMTSWLANQNLMLYSQADGTPRHQMLERFKQNPRGVLFGTDSFWQGVDVPGDALQCVIITKLPFSVPDHPLLEARLQVIRENGGNPFHDYQLPEAIIKLRQGFGRLIRTSSDHGTVVLLDPRIRSKAYGRLFLESLPDCEIVEEHV